MFLTIYNVRSVGKVYNNVKIKGELGGENLIIKPGGLLKTPPRPAIVICVPCKYALQMIISRKISGLSLTMYMAREAEFDRQNRAIRYVTLQS